MKEANEVYKMKGLFLEHLNNERDSIRDELFKLINENNKKFFNSKKMFEIATKMKEIETLETFIKDEFDNIVK